MQALQQNSSKSDTTHAHSILIVDDESSIRKTLQGVFADEGFQVLVAEDGAQALQLLAHTKPSVVLLDIWMPGSDGLEILQRIKGMYPEVPVIMISGHATIATAIKSTHLGASDFVEKPLDLNATLASVKRALAAQETVQAPEAKKSLNASEEAQGLELRRTERTPLPLNRLVFEQQALRGRKIVQKTLTQSTVLYGQGLHSGRKSGLILEPLPPNSGIHFVGVSETTAVPAHVDFVDSTGFATTVKLGQTQAGTIEHLMSALHAYGIANLLVKCNGEVPVLDGSAREFCALFDEVGTVEQAGEWYEIAIPHPIRVGNDREWIQIEPADEFIIDYTLKYGDPIGLQHFVFTLNSPEQYKEQIASCRTFGFLKDIGMLQKQGLALGGRFDNFVLIGQEGVLNGNLRFPDEPARHKILDAIGDLYLLGRRLRGKVTAHMTGHSDNIALLREIRNLLQKSL